MCALVEGSVALVSHFFHHISSASDTIVNIKRIEPSSLFLILRKTQDIALMSIVILLHYWVSSSIRIMRQALFS